MSFLRLGCKKQCSCHLGVCLLSVCLPAFPSVPLPDRTLGEVSCCHERVVNVPVKRFTSQLMSSEELGPANNLVSKPRSRLSLLESSPTSVEPLDSDVSQRQLD